jgi:hypothetical protein
MSGVRAHRGGVPGSRNIDEQRALVKTPPKTARIFRPSQDLRFCIL